MNKSYEVPNYFTKVGKWSFLYYKSAKNEQKSIKSYEVPNCFTKVGK